MTAVSKGSSAPSSMKIEAKTGMTFQSRKMETTTAKMTMATGIDHGLPDLGPELDGLLDVLGQPPEHDVEGAALLARGDEVAVEVVEDLGVFPLGLVQGRAGLDVVLDGVDDPLEVLVLLLFGQDAQALDERQLGVDEDRELAAVNGQLLEPDLFALEERGATGRSASSADTLMTGSAPSAGSASARRRSAATRSPADDVPVLILALPSVNGHGSPPTSATLRPRRAVSGLPFSPSFRWMMSVSSSGNDVTLIAMS